MHVPPGVIRPQSSRTEWLAEATLPTRHGNFVTHVFRSTATGELDAVALQEHVALVFGEVAGKSEVLVRVHSECMTSEVFGSLKCDCKEQLDASMAAIARAGAGAVLYLRQEGRGIGLANKIRAYALQSHGHDTVDANRMLGLPDDARRYDVARDILEHLGIASVRLMTNNPTKVSSLRDLGRHRGGQRAHRRRRQRTLGAVSGGQATAHGPRLAPRAARVWRRGITRQAGAPMAPELGRRIATRSRPA